MGNSLFKSIIWPQTFQLNVLRAFVAGIVWVLIAAIFKIPMNEDYNALYMIIGMPFIYLFIFMPIGLLAAWLSGIGVPYVGLISFFPSMIIFPADPFMFIIHKISKSIVPVEEYKFISFEIIIFVLLPDYVEEE